MLKEEKFPGESGVLNVAVGPDSGPPLVLLHGVTRRWQDFLPIVPALSTRWHLHALDFRGHGSSGRAPGKYLVAHYVEDAVALLDRLPQPAAVYGHSLGAMAAAGAAALRPDRVLAVVLEDPPFDTLGARIRSTPFHAAFNGMREARLAEGRSVERLAALLAEVRTPVPNPDGSLGQTTVRLGDVRDATSLRFSARGLLDMDPEVLTPIVEGRWLEGFDAGAALRLIEGPALLLQADTAAGGMLPDADAAAAAAALRRGSLVKVPRTGHLLHWLAAETVERLVLGFLESL